MDFLILLILISGILFYFISEKYENKRKLIFLFIQPLFILILFGSYIYQNYENIKVADPIEIKPTKDKFNFIAGEDFPEGRYVIKSKNEKGIVFIRNEDGEKIVSITLNGNKKVKNEYEATFTKGMTLAVLDVDEVELIPVNTNIQTEFPPGIWVIGQDIIMKDNTYSVKNNGDVIIIITDKNNKEKIRINKESSNVKVKLEQGDMIRVIGDGSAIVN